MKKLLRIVVLGLLWCNIGIAQCIQGDCNNGQGTWLFKDGDKYIGEHKNARANGQGTLIYASPVGEKYIGEFKDDKFHGQGTYIYADGDKFVGEWKLSVKQGQGTYFFYHGAKETGEYINGEPHGSHIYILSDGVTKEENNYRYGERIYILKEKSNSKTGKGNNTGRDYIPLVDKGISGNGIWGTRCYYSNGKTLEIESPRIVQIEGGWPPKWPAKY